MSSVGVWECVIGSCDGVRIWQSLGKGSRRLYDQSKDTLASKPGCVSSIVVSTSRCGRDIPGSTPGWRNQITLSSVYKLDARGNTTGTNSFFVPFGGLQTTNQSIFLFDFMFPHCMHIQVGRVMAPLRDVTANQLGLRTDAHAVGLPVISS